MSKREFSPGKFETVEMVTFLIGLGYSILLGVALAFILFVASHQIIKPFVYTWVAIFASLTIFTLFWKIMFLPYLRKRNIHNFDSPESLVDTKMERP